MPWGSFDATHLNILISLLILSVSAWTLWLSHYRDQRSEVKLQPLESASGTREFSGGSHKLNDRAHWNGYDQLRLSNTGERGAYLTSVDHELIEFRKKDGMVLEDPPVEIAKRERKLQREIDPNRNTRYRPRLRLEPETHIGPMVEYDIAVVRHTLVVEDNKGAYEVAHDSEMELTGPGDVTEKWEEEREDFD